MNDNTFEPDWLSAPGGTILDVIEERGMSSKELAGLLGYSLERMEKLISGREAITRDVAALLAERVGGSEKFWLSRENNYRNEVARLQSSGSMTAAKAWLSFQSDSILQVDSATQGRRQKVLCSSPCSL
jgi:HTH-type transcriptional regulator/antitoxin HigA